MEMCGKIMGRESARIGLLPIRNYRNDKNAHFARCDTERIVQNEKKKVSKKGGIHG